MSDICKKCGQAKTTTKLPEHYTEMLGIPLTLVNAVSVTNCACGHSSDDIEIPNLKGLIAAAAMTRVFYPHKLSGREIRFLRKSVDMSAKDLAKRLEVTAETVSRWENDKAPMGPASEKFFRMLIAVQSQDEAPAIDADLKVLGLMEICGFSAPGEAVPMCFELVRFKGPNQKPEDEYEGKAA